MERPQKNLTQLFIPISLETFFFMFTGMADTLMLSSLNDQSVGAIGTANTYISIFKEQSVVFYKYIRIAIKI